MKIAVIADTHIPNNVGEIPKAIRSHLKDVDLILHAGDLIELSVLEELEKIAPVRAVWGNMDPSTIRRNLPAKEIVKAGKFMIGLTHGSGPPLGLRGRVKKLFEADKVDCIVYGHSHAPESLVEDGILFFNPGSPTDEVFAPCKSFGMLYIDDEIKGEIIRL